MVTNWLPNRVRGHPHKVVVFDGSAAASVVIGLNAVLGWATGIYHLPVAVVLVDLGVAAVCAAFAIGIARGVIATASGLERAASVAVCCLFCAALAEMVAVPTRFGPLTAQACLIVVVAGVVIRSRRTLASLVAGAITSWSAVALLVDAAGFEPLLWLPTWVITVAVAFAMQWIISTERHVEQRARRHAQSSSLLDPLTSLANRRGFLRQAQPLVALAGRGDQSVWCAFLDVDHFKSVNDLLGHDAGDAVLVAIASALTNSARSSDVPARWGGDEFVMVGLGSAPRERDLEQRIVADLWRLPSDITDSWPPGVTVGISVADPPGAVADDALKALVDEADRTMYGRRARKRAVPTGADSSAPRPIGADG